MANINRLGMADELRANPNITVSKVLFGLVTNYIYNPTGAKLKVAQLSYNAGNGDSIKRLLALGVEGLKKGLKEKGLPKPLDIGSMQLNICYSTDHRFLAMQMEQYIDFFYKPTTELVIAEGDDAQLILSTIEL